jgi:choloylglycine hydrolase
MKMKSKLFTVLFMIFLAVSQATESMGCSIFRVTAKDGTVITGRTNEFGLDFKYAMIRVPRGKSYVSPAPDNSAGIKWKTRYGYVAMNVFGEEAAISDGLNEAGLSFGWLWYENDMLWQAIGPKDKPLALAHYMFGAWVLGNFSSVDEAAKEIRKIKVFGYKNPDVGGVPIPGHFILHDAKGGCIVIEYEQGELRIYDNPLGIMTNAPNFPWMLTNLRNYIGMTSDQHGGQDFSGMKFNPTGHGSGMFGLPGDITPPSRFVRLAVMTKYADQQEDSQGALNLAQHIVSALHIIKGMVVDRAKDGRITASETTQWSAYRDHANRAYYFRTYDNFNLRKIDLKRLDFTADKAKTMELYGDREIITDVTDRFK